MKYIMLMIMLFAAPVYGSDIAFHAKALDNFIYVADDESNEWSRYDTDSEFYGDCEDFAFSLQQDIGGKVYYTFLNKSLPHAVLVKDGLVYDMDYNVVTVAQYQKTNTILFSTEMVYGYGYKVTK